MDLVIHIIILYLDEEVVCMIIGIQVATIMIIYGEEKMIQNLTIDEQMKQIQQIDNDHVQNDTMCLVHENGDFW